MGALSVKVGAVMSSLLSCFSLHLFPPSSASLPPRSCPPPDSLSLSLSLPLSLHPVYLHPTQAFNSLYLSVCPSICLLYPLPLTLLLHHPFVVKTILTLSHSICDPWFVSLVLFFLLPLLVFCSSSAQMENLTLSIVTTRIRLFLSSERDEGLEEDLVSARSLSLPFQVEKRLMH